MNFDYLQGLHSGAQVASNELSEDGRASGSGSGSASGSGSGLNAIGGIDNRDKDSDISKNMEKVRVDDSTTLDIPLSANARFVNIMDQLDARVEKFRKDALNLQETKDYLLMSMDLVRSNDMLQKMGSDEHEECMLYIKRVSSRLATVELSVQTVRDPSQEDSLSQINVLIDTMIKMGDPVISRQRCQLYLNACCSTSIYSSGHSNTVPETDVGPIDKNFESALLGCTLDDQKNIKKRLQALLGYLNKQTVNA